MKSIVIGTVRGDSGVTVCSICSVTHLVNVVMERIVVRRGGAEVIVEGVQHSPLGLAHDRMHGGVKGRKKSKKDKLREAAAAAAAAAQRRGEAEQNNMQG